MQTKAWASAVDIFEKESAARLGLDGLVETLLNLETVVPQTWRGKPGEQRPRLQVWRRD